MNRPANLFINPDPKDGTKLWSPSATYYECGICCCFHAVEFDGDCRQDNARINSCDEIDEHHGAGKWTEVSWEEMCGETEEEGE